MKKALEKTNNNKQNIKKATKSKNKDKDSKDVVLDTKLLFDYIYKNNINDFIKTIASYPKEAIANMETADKGDLIYYTTLMNRLDILKALIDKLGISYHTSTELSLHGILPLHYVAQSKGKECIKYLIDHAKKNSTANISIAYEADNSSVDILKFNALPPVCIAAALGHTNTLKILIKEHKADPLAPIPNGPYKGMTPVGLATARGHINTVKVLIEEYQADPLALINEGTNKGMTLVYVAASHGWSDMTKMLIEKYQVDPLAPILDEVSYQGMAPGGLAALIDQINTQRMLSGSIRVDPFNSIVDEVSYKGMTPAGIAAIRGYPNTLKVLIESGKVDPSAPLLDGRYEGMTPVTLVVVSGHTNTFNMLLESGKVDPSAPLLDGRYTGLTLLDLAVKNNRTNIIEALILHGVHTNISSNIKILQESQEILDINNCMRQVASLEPLEIFPNINGKQVGSKLFTNYLLKNGLPHSSDDLSINIYNSYQKNLREKYVVFLDQNTLKEFEEIIDKDKPRYEETISRLESYLLQEDYIEYLSQSRGISKGQLSTKNHNIDPKFLKAENQDPSSSFRLSVINDSELKTQNEFMKNHPGYVKHGVIFKELINKEHMEKCGFTELEYRLNKHSNGEKVVKELSTIILPRDYKVMFDQLDKYSKDLTRTKLKIATVSSLEDQLSEQAELLEAKDKKIKQLKERLEKCNTLQVPADKYLDIDMSYGSTVEFNDLSKLSGDILNDAMND